MADDAVRIAHLESVIAGLRAREAALVAENAALASGRSEALEQQTVTAEVLRVIASSPADLQAVLATIAESAARLCEASDAVIFRTDGVEFWAATRLGAAQPRVGGGVNIGPGQSGSGRLEDAGRYPVLVGPRAMREQRTVHIPDAVASTARNRRGELYRESDFFKETGIRSRLAAPLLREGEAIGAIVVDRTVARPFTDEHIRLLETFADQAVIAIENARLFEELERRNAQLQESNRQVTEALEQQTATSDLLRVIASSPADAGPVLEAVAQSAMRLSDSVRATVGVREGDRVRIAATAGDSPHAVGATNELSQHRPGAVSILEGRTIHIPDLSAPSFRAEFPDTVHAPPEADLTTPLLRGREVIGSLNVSRDRARPYSGSTRVDRG